MNIHFTPEDEFFRNEIAAWLKSNLCGEFEAIRNRGGPGDEHMFFEERYGWERQLASAGWVGIAWPSEYGGRGLSIDRQVIFFEEYARAGGPGRVGHIGEQLVAPTLLAFGSEDQRRRFLPGIRSGRELWCQGYSEPDAGSDLANVRMRATYDSATDEWVLHGQKLWTSLAMESQWCVVLARCEAESRLHKGLIFLLVKMDQPGIDVRPIRQITGTSEFNEVFFDGARAKAADVVGAPGDGWKVAMGLLGFERGVSTLGQQMGFSNELEHVMEIARGNAAAGDPLIRQRIADLWIRLRVMRYTALRTLSRSEEAGLAPEAMIYKITWATWHRELGELAMDVLGPEAEIIAAAPYELTPLQSLALFTRSDTIYGGTNQIQRNIIAERALGMPKEPRGNV